MIYTTYVRRKKAATELAAMLKTHGRHIAKQLEPRMTAVLKEGEKMPDVAHLLDVIGRMLELESEGLEAATDARSDEGSEVKHARRELRERAEPELRERVIWVRDQMRNAYGAKEANRLLANPGRTPRGREDLKALAEHMVSFLPRVEPPKQEKPGSTVTPRELAEYLRPALDDFSRYLGKLGRHSGSEVEVVEQRKQALATFDQNYSRVVRLTELFYQLSGLESLIKHLSYHPGDATGRPVEQVPRSAARRQKSVATKTPERDV